MSDKPDVHITGMDESDAYEYLDVTPNDDLRELVERMRGIGVKHIDAHRNQEKWADELEELINDE